MAVPGLWRVGKGVEALRRRWGMLVRSWPRRVQCNACGWQGRCFLSDDWHPFTVCPRCGSEVRQRLLCAALSEIPELSAAKLVRGKRVLHVAAEPMVERALSMGAAQYVTADLVRRDVDLNLDLSNMTEIDDGAFDLLVAVDVLEHVPNDRRALQEIFRVLSPGGWAILSVPQKDDLARTFKDPAVTTPEAQEKAYGVAGHLRIYGDDFGEMVEDAGFEVTVVDEEMFENEKVREWVLAPPVLSRHPLATNHRKVFFARKC